LILDGYLEGAGASATASNGWGLLLARAESLKFTCIAEQVSSAPTIRIDLLGRNTDGQNEPTVGGTCTKILFNGVIQPGVNVLSTYGPADATFPPPRYLQILAYTTAGSGKARLKIWACGRGPQLLEAIPSIASSFATQYAAAKMLNDEDMTPQQKEALRPGASLFYPPELFEPSLRWER
jgi:hypothetical protein